MPVAATPLWQLEQFVSVAAWAKAAPLQVVVLLWQVEHSAVVATWPVPFPCAPDVPWLTKEPLWQELHATALAAAWFIV
jgi:hypothetical protein